METDKPNRQCFLVHATHLSWARTTGFGTEWLDTKPQPNHVKDCALSLAEAARTANIDIVRTLLPIRGYSQSNLRDVLIAASSSGDIAILDLVITHVGENRVDFQWPPELLCRAAQSRLENVVTRLLKFGGSLETAVTLHGSTPLYLAARHDTPKL